MLIVNPDGRKKAETGLSWRKNTNQNYCGATSNSRGADLNRNFTYAWNSTNGSGSSGSQCNETYRGPTAASEPETRAIEAYARSIWPDRRGPGANDPALTPAGPDVTKPAFVPNAATTAVTAGTSLALSSSATDTRFNQSNGTETTQAIAGAEYYIDVPPWKTGAVAKALSAADGSFNSTTEGLAGTISTTGLAVGKHMVFVRAKDASGAWGPFSAEFIQIK